MQFAQTDGLRPFFYTFFETSRTACLCESGKGKYERCRFKLVQSTMPNDTEKSMPERFPASRGMIPGRRMMLSSMKYPLSWNPTQKRISSMSREKSDEADVGFTPGIKILSSNFVRFSGVDLV